MSDYSHKIKNPLNRNQAGEIYRLTLAGKPANKNHQHHLQGKNKNNKNQTKEGFVPLTTATKRLGVTIATVSFYIKHNSIPSYRDGRCRLVHLDTLFKVREKAKKEKEKYSESPERILRQYTPVEIELYQLDKEGG